MGVTNALRMILPIMTMLAIAGCGFTTSDEDRLQRASEQIESGAYRSAMIELKNVLANNSENVQARLMLAEVSLGLGDVAAAEKEMARAAEFGAAEADIRLLNLRILTARNAYSEVLAALASETGGLSEAQQFEYRARALLGIGNVDAAAESYRNWLALDAGSVDAAVGLARTKAIAGDTEAAIADLLEIVSRNPQHTAALSALGSLYASRGDYENAAQVLESAVASSKPQSNIRQHVLMLGALTESQLALGRVDDARGSIALLSSIVPQSPMTLFLSARLARMEQDYALAARQLQQLLNISPDNQQAQVFLANVQMMQGHYAQAEVLLNRVVSISPDNILARKLLAQVQVRQDQPQGAMEALAPLIDHSEEDADVYNLLAQISMQQGDVQSVIQNLRAATESSPGDMEAKLNLAAAYVNIGEIDLGKEVLAAVPETDQSGYRRQQLQLSIFRAEGRSADAARYATDLLGRRGDEPEVVLIVSGHFLTLGEVSIARQLLLEFIGRHPDEIRTLIALGRLEIAENNPGAAKPRFETVQKIEPENLFAYLGLARVAEMSGDPDQSLSILKSAAEKHPGAVAPRVWLASRFLAAGSRQAAEKTANELLALGVRNSIVNEIVGRVLVEVGRLEEAVVQFETAGKLDPGSPSIQLNAARAYLALDRTVEARASLGRALVLSPGWIPAKSLLALVDLRQGRSDEAMQHVSDLRDANPDDVSVMVLEGEVFLYQGDFLNAAAAFHRAVEKGAGIRSVLREFQARVNAGTDDPEVVLQAWLKDNSNDVIARTTLAQFYLQTGKGDKAISEFELVLKAQPDSAPVLNNLAWQYQQVGNLNKALELATRAYEVDSQTGAIADTLGWIYRDLGQLEKSLELLGSATQLAPENGEIRFHFATVLAETGRSEQAREILQELITREVQFPSRELASNLLEQL